MASQYFTFGATNGMRRPANSEPCAYFISRNSQSGVNITTYQHESIFKLILLTSHDGLVLYIDNWNILIIGVFGENIFYHSSEDTSQYPLSIAIIESTLAGKSLLRTMPVNKFNSPIRCFVPDNS